MKYPSGGNGGVNTNCNNGSKRFNDQYETLLSLFEQWNDCERTVALYALLKRVPYSNLKFLQLSIEDNLSPMYTPQNKLHIFESNSNNVLFLNKLINKYKNFGVGEALSQSRDSFSMVGGDSGSGVGPPSSYGGGGGNDGKYEKKEDILNDILTYLPLLRPGNDEAKKVYMNLIPLAVDDAVRQIVPTEPVQQVFSYLLIHPAYTHEDRRSLSQWLRHLQEHISTSGTTAIKQQHQQNPFSFLPSADLQSPYLTSSTSSLSSASWQTVAPPPQPSSGVPNSISNQDNNTNTTPWDIHTIQVTQEFCDDLNELTKSFKNSTGGGTGTSTKQQQQQQNGSNNSGLVVNVNVVGGHNDTSSSHITQNFDTTAAAAAVNSCLISSKDDLHVSFSKNGTEIVDFDYDDFKSNTQIAFDISCDFLTVPGGQWDAGTIKTRRSNSLTTAATTSQNTCSSAENLSSIVQKPRSFSLSGESSRSNLTSHGSETRLDDITKTGYIRYNSQHNVGMNGIGQWLKSLRLHKYVWLFTHLTYEQMLDITEDYLENLGVTKGARHKLVLCIQKLHDRAVVLHQMEKNLMSGVKEINEVLEDLTQIVVTPMKPVDIYNKDDVAALFFKVLNYISTMTASRPVCSQQDEDTINVILWLLERALHNEAFMAQTNQLREHKFKLNKMKSHFTNFNKTHFNKSGGNGSGKLRWNNSQKHKSGSSEGLKIHRKNSSGNNHFTQILNSANHSNQNQQQQQQNQAPQAHQQQPNGMYYHSGNNSNNKNNNNNNNYNKSSSYPNFISNAAAAVLTNNTLNAVLNMANQQQAAVAVSSSQQQQQQTQLKNSQEQQSVSNAINASLAYHRHSLNNLITVQQPMIMQQAISTTVSIPVGPQQSQQQQQQQKTISGNENLLMAPSSSTTNNKDMISQTIVSSSNINPQQSQQSGTTINTSSNNISNSIGDINSRLEFLCLQMTEQAIN